MSFLRKIFGDSKSKVKQVRGESKLTLQDEARKRTTTTTITKEKVETIGSKKLNLKAEIVFLEEKLNQPDTRKSPPNHITVIRKLAKYYQELGKEDASYYVKAENLYKQMNVLYPLHMEKIDWLIWINLSAKAKLIKEARRLLQEARMIFPGDSDFDKVETEVLHITDRESSSV